MSFPNYSAFSLIFLRPRPVYMPPLLLGQQDCDLVRLVTQTLTQNISLANAR